MYNLDREAVGWSASQVHSTLNSSIFVPRQACPTGETTGMLISAATSLFPSPPCIHRPHGTHRSYSKKFLGLSTAVRVKAECVLYTIREIVDKLIGTTWYKSTLLVCIGRAPLGYTFFLVGIAWRPCRRSKREDAYIWAAFKSSGAHMESWFNSYCLSFKISLEKLPRTW